MAILKFNNINWIKVHGLNYLFINFPMKCQQGKGTDLLRFIKTEDLKFNRIKEKYSH